jgi:IMP dehydrogenase
MSDDFPLALTYDDVLLVPRRSGITSRRAVDTSTLLTPRIPLAIPIVSANMDTVTESAMAIALARMGGIGIIHRFLPIARQVAEVAAVKRSEAWVIDQPWTLAPTATVGEARERMAAHGVGGLPIVEADGRLVGLVTTRDLLFAPDPTAPVATRMTPRERLVTAPAHTDLESARALLDRHRLEKLPLVDASGRLAGLITTKDIVASLRFPHATKDDRGRLRVGAAIGVVGDYLERAAALVEAGADVLVLDIAHGHAEHALRAIAAVRRRLGEIDLIAGNVATAEGARDLADAGADAVKVGVGPGSICITRLVAGVGVPQLTAVLDCARALEGRGVPLIADGGIRRSGDIVKALAAGAATVMLGNLLAGTTESPGVTIRRGGGKYKVTRGMASVEAAMHRQAREDPERGWAEWEDDLAEVVPEGVEAAVPYRGDASEVIVQLVGGLRSGLSYCNARTLAELRANARFVRITEAGRVESGAHDVEAL